MDAPAEDATTHAAVEHDAAPAQHPGHVEAENNANDRWETFSSEGHGAEHSSNQQSQTGRTGADAAPAKRWPDDYSYMCGGLFVCDSKPGKMLDNASKVHYLTRRPEAISPEQDERLRGRDGLFCRFFNEEEDCTPDSLDEPYPIVFFPWQHDEDGTLDDAVTIARKSLAEDPQGKSHFTSNPVFFLDAQSAVDNTVLGVELSWGGDPEDDPVAGLVMCYGRLPVRQISIFQCIAEVKGFSLQDWMENSAYYQVYHRPVVQGDEF